MLAERREEAKRFKVLRPVELTSVHSETIHGITADVSDRGIRVICADVTSPLSVGSRVSLRLVWDEDNPSEPSSGRVVWSAPSSAGSGVEMGLVITDEAPSEVSPVALPKETAHVSLPETGALPEVEHGTRLIVQVGGVPMKALVYRIGAMDAAGEVVVRLQVVGDSLGAVDSAAHKLTAEEENFDFENHPVRDLLNTCRRYTGPVACFLAVIWSVIAPLMFRGARWAYGRLSEQRKAQCAVIAQRGYRQARRLTDGLQQMRLHAMRRYSQVRAKVNPPLQG